MKTSSKNQIVGALTAAIALSFSMSNLGGQNLDQNVIDGMPLRIQASQAGAVQVFHFHDFRGTEAFYRQYFSDFQSILFVGEDRVSTGRWTPPFTAATTDMPNPWTIRTSGTAMGDNIRWTQTISYQNGLPYYTKRWAIENIGSTTLSNLRFLHGGDTYFANFDSSRGYWDENLRMVYLMNPDNNVSGLMGFSADPSTPSDQYHEGNYSTVWSAMGAGILPNTVQESYHDAAYALRWSRDSLAPGETWSIISYEKWTEAGFVQVIAPPEAVIRAGATVTTAFTVANLQTTNASIELEATTSDGVTAIFPQGSRVEVGPTSSVSVPLEIFVPGDLEDGQSVNVTLGARDLATGESNSDILAIRVLKDMPVLDAGELTERGYVEGRVQQYFELRQAETGGMTLSIADAPPGFNMFLRFGDLPTRSNYNYRLTSGDSLIVPHGAAGSWYVMIFAEANAAGRYSMLYQPQNLILGRISPATEHAARDFDIRLFGAGFFGAMDVRLVASNGATYEAMDVMVDSFSQATATFAAGSVPAGTYSVRVNRNGLETSLNNAFRVVNEGAARLETNLILPESVGYNALATMYVEYRNAGNIPMSAPLLSLTAIQNNRQAAILTLKQQNLSRGFWMAGMPSGFSSSVEFLASGETPGVLQPGETGRVPVYYTGWLQPWDTSGSRPPIDWRLSVLDVNNTVPVDWDGLKFEMKPDYVSQDAWDVLWQNFVSQVGPSWGDYVATLNRNAVYLHRRGLRVEDIPSLLAYSMRLAEGFSPIPVLARGVDAVVEAPGLPVVFERILLQSTSRRFVVGDMGRGWTHNWHQSLSVASDRTVSISDSSGSQRAFSPDSRYSNRYLAQAGDEGILVSADGGFRLTEKTGHVKFYRNGKLEFLHDPNGNRITCTYTGELLTRLTHSAGGHLTIAYAGDRIASVTDHHGRATQYTYTGEYLTSVQGYAGRTVGYSYHTANGAKKHALARTTLPGGTQMHYDYDEKGQLAAVWRDDEQEKVTFAYGTNGRVSVTDALGDTSRLYFDHEGRIVRAENALGEATHIAFDELGNLTQITDPVGMTTTMSYDRQGNLMEIRDGMQRSTRFSYTRGITRLATVTDPLGRQTSHDYDGRGNLTSLTYPDGNRESWAYDSSGNPTAWTNRRGAAVGIDYDDAGRMTRKRLADNSEANYRYDARGNLIEAGDAGGITSFTYNPQDYLVRIDYPQGRHLTYAYDSVGRRTSMTDQLGNVLNYHYDSAGRLHRLNDGAADVVVYAYDELGRIARQTMENGVYTTYTYDPAGRLLRQENFQPGGEVLSRFAYTYDRRGRRVAMNTHYGAWTYGYDEMGQLVSAVLASTDPAVPNQNLLYEYDALGNRVRTVLNGQTQGYNSNILNQYTQVGDRTYTYDLDGNLIREDGPDGVTTYTYNDENRLVGINKGGSTWEFTYDALGNRVAAAENGESTHYLIDPAGLGNVVGEYTQAGSLVARYTHGFGLVNRLSGSGTVKFYSFDPMGNTSELTAAGGAIQNAYAYNPFGNTILNSETVPNPFLFMGQFGVSKETSGIDFVRARFYDGSSGRFMSADPIGFAGNDNNLYRYGFNNPISHVDPNGEAIITTALVLKGIFWLGVAGVVTSINDWGQDFKDRAESNARRDANWVKNTSDMINYPDHPNHRALEREAYGRRKDAYADGLESARRGVGVGVNTVINFTPGIGDAKTVYDEARGQGVLARFWRWIRGPQTCPTNNQRRSDSQQSAFRSSNFESSCMPMEVIAIGATRVVASWDPNEKTTVAGFGPANHVRPGRLLTYRVDFENYASATAPAQIVTIRDPLSNHLDHSTVELGEIRFGDMVIPIPPNSQYFETVVPYAYTDDEYDFVIDVHIEAWLENGQLYFNFTSIDPETQLPPPAAIGFLMPETNPATGRGRGYVTYLVRAREDVPSGTAIRNIATIQFDQSLQINTNQVDPLDASRGTDPNKEALVTIDGLPPTSAVNPLPAETYSTSVVVTLSGSDDPGGSGIASYDVFVRTSGGDWAKWLTTSETSVTFTGEQNVTYDFYSVATDNVGYREAKAPVAEATTKVQVMPVISSHPERQTVTVPSGATFNVGASGAPPLRYQWQISTNGGSSWQDIARATSASYTVVSTSPAMNSYRYRCVVSNGAGSVPSNAAVLVANRSYGSFTPGDPGHVRLAVGGEVALSLASLGGEVLRVRGLPRGLRFDAATQMVTGFPAMPNRRDVPYTVSALVQKADGSREAVELRFDVEGIPGWVASTYQGYVEVPDPARSADALGRGGMMDLRINARGVYSGRVMLGGQVLPIRGQLEGFVGQNLPGSIVAAKAALAPVRNDSSKNLILALEFTQGARGAGYITGELRMASGAPRSGMPAGGWQNPWHTRNNPAWGGANRIQMNTVFAAAVPPPGSGIVIPEEPGNALVRLGRNGQAQILGNLADGTRFTGAAVVSSQGDFLLYRSLYRHGGLALLIMQADRVNESPNKIEGDLNWVKFPNDRARDYPDGFDITTPAVGTP